MSTPVTHQQFYFNKNWTRNSMSATNPKANYYEGKGGMPHFPPPDPCPFPNAWNLMVLVVYLIRGVGLRVLKHGDGRGKLSDRPMETLALLSETYFIWEETTPRLESHRCLTDVPTVHSSSSRIGASGWLGTCHAPYIPRRVPASSEFGKHHR